MDPFWQTTSPPGSEWYAQPTSSYEPQASGIMFDGYIPHEGPSEYGSHFHSDSQMSGQSSIDAGAFRLPSVPASAYWSRTEGQQGSLMSSDLEFQYRTEKIRRTRTACEECRKRKQKCDGNEPCKPCTEQTTECRYRDVPPTKKDDAMSKMLQLAESYNTTLAALSKDVDAMNSTLRSIERRLDHTWRAGSVTSPMSGQFPMDQGTFPPTAAEPETYHKSRSAQAHTSSRRR